MTFEQWFENKKREVSDRGHMDTIRPLLEEAFYAGDNAQFEEKWVGKSPDYPGGGKGKVACGAFPCICGICNEDVYPTRGG